MSNICWVISEAYQIHCCTNGKNSCFTPNIRLGWKCSQLTNNLAYLATSITIGRCFIKLAFEANAATGADEKCLLTKNSKHDVKTQPRKSSETPKNNETAFFWKTKIGPTRAALKKYTEDLKNEKNCFKISVLFKNTSLFIKTKVLKSWNDFRDI